MSAARVLIVGVGNVLLGDEGAGVHVARSLARSDLPNGLEARDGGTGGLDLLFLIEEADGIVFVDAARMGLPAGEIRAFGPDELAADNAPGLRSLHGLGLPEVLELACRLGVDTPVRIVGIEPLTLTPGAAPSPPVAARIASAAELAVAEARLLLERLRRERRATPASRSPVG